MLTPTKNTSSSIWDKKAKQYGRFSKNLTSFQENIFTKIAQRGISFEDKTILDIGCGTGIYTLHLALKAKKITALDFSQEMLDILAIDARTEHLDDKIIFTCSDWQTYDKNASFDIIFSSMSPAFKSDGDFEKMHNSTKESCIYLGWGGKRESELLDAVFKAHGFALKAPPGSEKLKLWLEKKKITNTCEYIEDEWIAQKSVEEAIESVLWHFEINDLKPDTKLVQKMVLEKAGGEDFVNFSVKVGLELISWVK